MKILKNVIFALAVIIVVAAVGIYFMPKEYNVENSVEINKTPDVVYAQLADYNQWSHWSPWKDKDPDAKVTVTGTPGTLGEKMEWDGAKNGQGCMTLYWTKPNESLHNNVEFIKPMSGKMKDGWTLEAANGKTKVTWANSGGLSFPLGRLFGSKAKTEINQMQVKGLDNLKKYCESLPAPTPTTASVDTTSVHG